MAGEKARAEALAEIQRLEEARAHWEAEEVAATAEGDDLRARMGSDVLDDPSRAGELTAALASTSSRAEVAASAAAAAVPRIRAARAAVLELDAAVFDHEADKLREQLVAHDARTSELLTLLKQHEGSFAPETVRGRENGGPEWRVPLKSDGLRSRLAVAEIRAQSLRAVAAGDDPRELIAGKTSIQDGSYGGVVVAELWPEAIRAGGVLPMPGASSSLTRS